MTPGSEEFSAKWKEVTKNNKEEFKKLEYEFIKKTHFDTVVSDIFKKKGIDLTIHSHTLNDVIWSTAVQHGPKNSVTMITKVLDALGLKEIFTKEYDKALIKAIYAERTAQSNDGHLIHFPSIQPNLKPGILKRFINEEKDALQRLENESDY